MGVSVTRIVKYILKGDKGDSAVNYYITLSAKTFAADSTGKPLNTTENISVTAYKQVGNNSAVALSTANGDNWDIAAYIRKNESNVSNYVSSNKDKLYIPAPGYAFNEIGVTFSVTINGTPQVYQQEIIQPLKQGVQGNVGAALRGPQAWSDCATGYSFQAGGQGDTWKDVVLYGDNYYSCVKNHTKTATNYPGSTEDSNNGYWQLGDKIELVATKILLATYALVKNLGVEAIDMKDSSGNILFQAKDGNVTCNTGTFQNIIIKGSNRSPFCYPDDSFDINISDNVSLSSSGSWLNAYSLPWDISQNGRKVVITNYKYVSGGSVGTSTGQISISAPSGKYFFQNGIQTTELELSREYAELIGYGNDTVFWGWIVLKRGDIVTEYNYGREKKVLIMAKVIGTSSGASMSAKTFDNSTDYTVTRNGTGIYTVVLPSSFKFSSSGNVYVMATGVGAAVDDSNSPLKATVNSVEVSTTGRATIVFWISDDASKNDGSFSFEVSNLGDWI